MAKQAKPKPGQPGHPNTPGNSSPPPSVRGGGKQVRVPVKK